jgi:protein-tyrosine phosphatase
MKPGPDIALVPVNGGKLALTHRPKKTDFRGFRELGVTHVITLLNENESAQSLGTIATNEGLSWIWCPLKGANIHASLDEVRAALEAGKTALASGGAVVIHCSAGIHRTGMFGYALLRVVGLHRAAAVEKLRELRAVTAEGVGSDRLEWGDRIAEELMRSEQDTV